MLVACILLLSVAEVAFALALARGEPLYRQAPVSSSLVATALVALVAVCGLRFASLPPDARRERRALAYLAIAFGLHSLVWLAPEPFTWSSLGIPFAASVCVLSVWLVGTRTEDSRVARNVVLGSAATGVAVLAYNGPIRLVADVVDYGNAGIARMIGFVFLVLAIVRHDLLAVPLPRLASAKGPMGAGALALFFIVAQLAQNFLSARLGLVMGGVVAGVFLFAAAPVQRAIENGRFASSSREDSDSSSAAREGLYRDALRIALRDRQLTPREELHLARLADELGIGAGRAMELRLEIEGEARPVDA